MEAYIKKELEKRIASFNQLPYLFVGTGLSMRYSHAPSWNELLLSIWKIVFQNKKDRDYEKLKQRIERDLNSESASLTDENYKFYVNPRLATVIESEFNNKYYEEDGFDDLLFSDAENNEIIAEHYNPFKYMVVKQMKSLKIDWSIPESAELSILKEYQNKIAGIITTNYDELLEEIFTDFSVLVGQDNMLMANSLSIFEIYKIHGNCTMPNSIVLTQNDYENFGRKLKYLSAKLLTIFVEHPIIFIGYGLGDINILNILQEIAGCLSAEQLEKIKDNFIFISPAFGKSERFSKNTLNWGNNSIVINEFLLNDYGILYSSLGNIQSSMPVKLARKLQDMVCNYVYSAKVQNNILFGDVNSPEIDEEKTAIYFGKADTVTQLGFSHFNIDDILEDVLFNNKPYLINKQLIEKTFKNIRSSAGSTVLPVYKYISALNYPKEKIPGNYNIIDGYNDSDILPTTSEKRNYIKQESLFNSIAEIEIKYPNHIPKQVANIKNSAKNISADELADYLKKHYKTEDYYKHISLFRRLIALYDFKKYSGRN